MLNASARFPADRGSVRQTRAWLRTLLGSWHLPPEAADDATLLTSELVSNVLVHVGTGYELRLLADGTTLRVEVQDQSDAAPAPRTSSPLTPGGRGLQLVRDLSSSWGWTSAAGGGKVVWFELTFPEGGPGAASPARP